MAVVAEKIRLSLQAATTIMMIRVIVCLNRARLKIVSVVVVLMTMSVEDLRLVVIRGVSVVTLVVTTDKNVKVAYVRAKDVASALST